MKHKLHYLLLLIVLKASYSSAQEVVEEIFESVEEETVIESTESSRIKYRNTQSQAYYKFKEKYETRSINNDFDWFYDKSETSYSKNYGIVDRSGTIILPNIFRYSSSGSEDSYYQILNVDGKYGMFDLRENQWVIPLNNNNVVSVSSNFYGVKNNDMYTLVNLANKPITSKKWASVEKIYSLENYVKVSELKNGTVLYGVFSLLEKKLIIPCQYKSFITLSGSNNIFKVKNEDNQYNLIDLNNEPVFKTWYQELTTMYKTPNRFIVKKDDKYGVINKREEAIIPIEYMSIESSAYSDGSHLSRNKNGKYGFITMDGEVTLPFKYDKIDKNYSSNNMISKSGDQCGVVTIKSGKPTEIISCEYDNITNLKAVLITEQNNKYGLLDADGSEIVEPYYDEINVLNNNSYSNKALKARKKKMFYLLSDSGQNISNKGFVDADIIPDDTKSNGFTFFKVKQKDEFQIMDKVGKIINENGFDDILSEYKNYFIVKKGNKYGLFSLISNKMVLDYSYDVITRTKEFFIVINGSNIDLMNLRQGKIVKI